jgi:MazG family protein
MSVDDRPAATVLEALAELDAISHRLRRDCPWDREQDERSIVPHTVEEAYELADAAHRGDDSKLLDELGDVLFQVVFLSLLLQERGVGDLGAVARHCTEKLIRRHPHVFGDARVASAGEVLRNWDAIKSGESGREPGLFGEVPENLPGPLYARKVLRRASSGGVEVPDGRTSLTAALDRDGDPFTTVGDALFGLVALARERHVDPELALRAAADRFRAAAQAGADEGASPPAS